MNTRIRLFLLGLPLLVFVFACSKSQTAASASGKVTYNGAVVPGGIIYFYSLKEDGTPGAEFSFVIKPDGTYSGTQLPEGDMVVTIDTESKNPNPEQRPKMDPSKYGGKGGMAEIYLARDTAATAATAKGSSNRKRVFI